MFRIFIEAHEAQSFNMFPWNEGLLIVYCEQNPRFYHEVDGTFYAGAWEKQGIWREQKPRFETNTRSKVWWHFESISRVIIRRIR